MNNIFSLDQSNGKITITTDPDIARDLAFILSTLLDLSRSMKAKMYHARALANITDEDLRLRREAFQKESRDIFIRFNEHLNNGCAGDKAKAIQQIKKEFKIGYGDAKICIQEGRRLSKLQQSGKIEQAKKRPCVHIFPDHRAPVKVKSVKRIG